MDYLSVKNWDEFQHYKDRNPPWIKLHNTLLDDYDFGRLPDAQKAHLLGVWMVAARTDNRIPYDPEWIGEKLCATEPVDLDGLIDDGWLVPHCETPDIEQWGSRYISKAVREQVWERDNGRCTACGRRRNIEYDHIIPVSKGGNGDIENVQLLCRACNRSKRNKLPSAEQVATHTVAKCSRLRSLETETETETETDLVVPPKKQKPYTEDFERFWTMYPYTKNQSKQATFRAWSARLRNGSTVEDIIEGTKRYVDYIDKTGTDYVKHAKTFIGPDKHFALEWEVDNKKHAKDQPELLDLRQVEK